MVEFWASIEVKRAAKVLHPATILSVSPDDTFGSLLGRVYKDFQHETVDKTLISSTMNKVTHSVPLNAPVFQV